MTQTPADEIRAAAAKLRGLATAASTDAHGHDTSTWSSEHVRPGDARLYGPGRTSILRGGPSGPGGRGTRPHLHPQHADYIAALHPGVGAVLADWLDATVAEVIAADGTEYALHPDGSDFDGWNAALTLARLINQ